MRVVLYGLGLVGTATAAALAAAGHEVLGVDPEPERVAALARGRAGFREPGLDELLARGLAQGRIAAARDAGDRLEAAELALVCVGTPPTGDGGLDLAALLGLTARLGAAVRRRPKSRPLLLVHRSTVPPGTMDGRVLPLLAEAAGEGPGSRYEVAYHPEFLRRGSAVADLAAPARIVVGERHPGASRRLFGLYAQDSGAPWFEVPFAAAELAKLADNAWHALKVAFANEVGRAATAAGAEPEAVMAILRADRARNLGPAYLRPGEPYGGPCLPKDLEALLRRARGAGLELPALAGVAPSNASHLAWLVARIRAKLPPPGPVLQLGLAFKAGTDELKGSPLLDLARALRAEGYELLLHDPDLAPARLRAAAATLGAAARPSLAAALRPGAGARLVLVARPVAGLAERLPAGLPVLSLAGLEGF